MEDYMRENELVLVVASVCGWGGGLTARAGSLGGWLLVAGEMWCRGRWKPRWEAAEGV